MNGAALLSSPRHSHGSPSRVVVLRRLLPRTRGIVTGTVLAREGRREGGTRVGEQPAAATRGPGERKVAATTTIYAPVGEPQQLMAGDVVEVLETRAISHKTGRAVVATVSTLDLSLGDRYTVRFVDDEHPYPIRFPRGALRLIRPAGAYLAGTPAAPATAAPVAPPPPLPPLPPLAAKPGDAPLVAASVQGPARATPGGHTPQDTPLAQDRPTPTHQEAQAAYAAGEEVLFQRPMRGAESSKWVGVVVTRKWLPEAGQYAYVVRRTGSSLPEIFLHRELQPRRTRLTPRLAPTATTTPPARGN